MPFLTPYNAVEIQNAGGTLTPKAQILKFIGSCTVTQVGALTTINVTGGGGAITGTPNRVLCFDAAGNLITTSRLFYNNTLGSAVDNVPQKLTTIQRNAIVAPATNLIIFNLDTNTYQKYDGANWIDIALTVIPSGGSLAGTYDTDVLCLDTVTITNNTTINGDLIHKVSGASTINVATGKYLVVQGDLIGDVTLSSIVLAGGAGSLLLIKGNCYIRSIVTNDGVTAGQRAGSVTIYGSLYLSLALTASGNNNAGGNGGLGGSVTIFGTLYTLVGGITISTKGGAGTGNGGNGGSIQLGNNVGNPMIILTDGGDSSSASAGGTAGNLIIYGSANTTTISLFGGDSNGGTAGQGGSATLYGGNHAALYSRGGHNAIGFTGGRPGSSFILNGSSIYIGILSISEGSGTVPIFTTNVTIQSAIIIGSWSITTNGTVNIIPSGPSSSGSLKIGIIIGKNTLNNFGGGATGVINVNDFFTITAGVWYKHIGAPA